MLLGEHLALGTRVSESVDHVFFRFCNVLYFFHAKRNVLITKDLGEWGGGGDKRHIPQPFAKLLSSFLREGTSYFLKLFLAIL